MTSYLDELKESIVFIRKETKAGRMGLADRLKLIDETSTKYALAHADYAGEIRAESIAKGNEPPLIPMDERVLEQLANLALYEDLTDNTAHKSRHSEYPFLSDIQLARRQTGRHERKNVEQGGEVPLKAAFDRAADGRNYSVPIRRKRSIYEDLLRDEKARIKNKERRARYNAFIKPGPVITYKFSELEAN